MQNTYDVFVWLPATQKFGIISSASLVKEMDEFCSNPLSPTIMEIKSTKKIMLFYLKKREKRSLISSLAVNWNKIDYPKSLYHIIKESTFQSETYHLHYASTLDTMSFKRMHEISDLVGIEGIARMCNMDDPFPGKRPHLLFKGYFIASQSNAACSVLVTARSRLEFRFGNANIVARLLNRHGDCTSSKTFRIEKSNNGHWLMKGVHPLVSTPNPNPRPFSLNHQQLKQERTPDSDSVLEIRRLIPDAMEMLRKASKLSSTEGSSGPKALMGSVSIKSSIRVSASLELETEMKREMQKNALVMDKLRYLLQTSILVGHIMSRVHTALDICKSSILKVKTRYKKDSRIDV
jgi:hypothetical protein